MSIQAMSMSWAVAGTTSVHGPSFRESVDLLQQHVRSGCGATTLDDDHEHA
jgi:hypothetical protein